jgi:hypothetical protein
MADQKFKLVPAKPIGYVSVGAKERDYTVLNSREIWPQQNEAGDRVPVYADAYPAVLTDEQVAALRELVRSITSWQPFQQAKLTQAACDALPALRILLSAVRP